MEWKGAPMVKARLARGSGVLLLIISRSSSALFCRKRLLAKALPELDLKYRPRLRAVASSATATYERRTAGKYLRVETTRPLLLRCKSTSKIVRGTGVDVAVADLKKHATRSPTGEGWRSRRPFLAFLGYPPLSKKGYVYGSLPDFRSGLV